MTQTVQRQQADQIRIWRIRVMNSRQERSGLVGVGVGGRIDVMVEIGNGSAGFCVMVRTHGRDWDVYSISEIIEGDFKGLS